MSDAKDPRLTALAALAERIAALPIDGARELADATKGLGALLLVPPRQVVEYHGSGVVRLRSDGGYMLRGTGVRLEPNATDQGVAVVWSGSAGKYGYRDGVNLRALLDDLELLENIHEGDRLELVIRIHPKEAPGDGR